MSEELISESPAEPQTLPDSDLSVDDFNKLTALMDDEGKIPPHHERADETEEPEPEKVAEPKQPQPEKQADSNKEGDAPKPAEKQQAEAIEVEYEGKKYTVPTELKDALLRQSDYTRKAQEVAAERQTVLQHRQVTEAMAQEAQQMVGQYAALQQIDAQLQQIPALYQQAMAAGNELQAIHLRQTASELQQTRNNAIAQLEHVRNMRQQAQVQQIVQATNEGTKLLAKEIPGWGAERQQALVEIAKGLGYGAQELAVVVDPRAVKMLNEIYTLRAENATLKGSQVAAQKQIRQAPPKPVRSSSVQEPGNEPPTAQREISRLRKSGSDEDALAALRALMG